MFQLQSEKMRLILDRVLGGGAEVGCENQHNAGTSAMCNQRLKEQSFMPRIFFLWINVGRLSRRVFANTGHSDLVQLPLRSMGKFPQL